MSIDDLSHLSMLDLFRLEVGSQTQVLTAGLLALERDPTAADQLEACMRAAHSLKGAARIVGLMVGVSVAHVMEECFVAAQDGRITLRHKHIDLLLRGVDVLGRIAQTPEAEVGQWADDTKPDVDAFLSVLACVLEGKEEVASLDGDVPPAPARAAPQPPQPTAPRLMATASPGCETSDRVLRVTAEHVNRLLGLAGESLVESRWLKPFAESLLRLNRLHYDAGKTLDRLRDALSEHALDEPAQTALATAQRGVRACRQFLSQRLGELDRRNGCADRVARARPTGPPASIHARAVPRAT